MRIRDIYSSGEFRLSIEIFPPKTDAGDTALFNHLERLAEYRPAFVSCTYGAGGSTQHRTLDLCAEIQSRFGLAATAHLTCVGATREELKQWLLDARDRGVENIMALRGDAQEGEDSFRQIEGGLSYANELVELIRSDVPELGIGVAGYPEKHPEAPDAATDLDNLRRKVDAGADAVFTQLFFINENFFEFRERYKQAGITVPLIPGIMPVTNFARIKRITSLCGAAFPSALAEKLEAAQDDDQAQFEIGVEFAIKQCRELMDHGVPGIHFYVLNKSKACEAILSALDYQVA